jgi:hypothetical protein
VKLPRYIKEALDASGKSWRVENRRKHYALVVEGRMVMVFPRGKKTDLPSNTKWMMGRIRAALEGRTG